MGLDAVSVYVHVPFCVAKCPYCDFASEAVGSRDNARTARYAGCVVGEFHHALERDAAVRGAKRPRLESLYFGGGTPSLLSPDEIGRIASAVFSRFDGARAAEVTLEANPETVTPESLGGYWAAGVNRLSIGVQSFDDAVLASLGRVHSASRSREAFTMARKAGFKNVGIDLIFGAPGQSMESWLKTLYEAAALSPEHVSVYSMTIEDGTPFGRIHAGGRGLPDERTHGPMYEAAVGILGSAGLGRYEISNFSRVGYRSRHNEGYWTGRRYIGLGAGAHSFDPATGWGVRRWNLRGAEEYMQSVELSGSGEEGRETLTAREAAEEAVMLGLRRLEEGVDLDAFAGRFGRAALSSGRIEELKAASFIDVADGRMRLTPRAVAVSDDVMASLISSLSV